ncbi:hypothetical protein BCR36DRAFT_411224 [Piromyces finnis]|uniref:SH3 domain-containing protein n=1 Tax=Piromyces finnis TaxID=1754191 RepID=A0A1Y1VDP6_9FUNG|nr:hypothetical protein BCR36DRAFT_411224 [Piromyces finnis]|eukprot:ORX53451.1 hypothetical protein BCR36DRAFT_411224 [Piromyces finnis]
MTFSDCDIINDIFKELKYKNDKSYSGYSCCKLDNIKCSENHLVKSLKISGINLEKDMKFPESIVQLRNLTTIDISNNKKFTDFPQLKDNTFIKINLSNTSISQPFPEWLLNQSSLKELNLSNTLITESPSKKNCLFKKSIKVCDLHNTPLCNKLLKNETINISLPKICKDSCVVLSSNPNTNKNNTTKINKNDKTTSLATINNNNNTITIISDIPSTESTKPIKNNKVDYHTTHLIVFSIGFFLLLIGFIVMLVYRYHKKKNSKEKYIFYTNDKSDDSSGFRKFFPFNTFKDADTYANKNRATKTILDSNNVIMFNVDECVINTSEIQPNLPNNNKNNNHKKVSKILNIYNAFISNCKDCHVNFVIFIDSLLRIKIDDKMNKKSNKVQKKKKNKKQTKSENNIETSEIPFGQIISDDEIECCYNSSNINIAEFENTLNGDTLEKYSNKSNKSANGPEILNNVNMFPSSKNISENEKANLWNSIPVSNIKDRDKYTKSEYFIDIINDNTTINSETSNDTETKLDNNDNKYPSISQEKNYNNIFNSDDIKVPENTASNGNFRISAITDGNKNSNNTNSTTSATSYNNEYDRNNKINDENRIINVEKDEVDSLIIKDSDDEKKLSWTSSKRDSGINSFSKKVSEFLSLNFSKHSSLVMESLNEKIFESNSKTKQKDSSGNEEDSERLLSENFNELKTEDTQNNSETITESIIFADKPKFIDHSSSISSSINKWTGKLDSILNMYYTNYYENKNNMELDEKYVFTIENSNNDKESNSNNKLSSNKKSFIYPSTLTYFNEIKNKILRHNSEASNNIQSEQIIKEEVESIKNNTIKNNKNSDSIHSYNPFLNEKIKNAYDFRNSIQSEQINNSNNNNDSSISCSLYSNNEIENSINSTSNDDIQIYTTDTNIINIFEDKDDPFVYLSKNNQINVTVSPVDVKSSSSTSNDNSIDNMLNDMLKNKSNSVLNINNEFEFNSELIIPRKSSKRIANRQRDLLYRNMNINEKKKEIPVRSSSIDYMKNGSVNENSKLLTRKYMSYWNYETLKEDELTVYIGDIIYIIRVFDDGWIYGKNTRTNKVGVVPFCLLEKLNS